MADIRHNDWESIPANVLALNGLVVLNASDNLIKEVAEGESGARRVCAAAGVYRAWAAR